MAPFCLAISTLVLLIQINIIHAIHIKVNPNLLLKDPSICNGRVCVPKCCAFNKYVFERTCTEYKFNNVTLDFSDMKVYDEDRNEAVSTVKKSIYLVPAKFDNTTFVENSMIGINRFNWYLTVTGDYYQEVPNKYNRWTKYDRSKICIDYLINRAAPYLKPVPQVWVEYSMTPIQDRNNFSIDVYGDLISSIFLLLVFLVYLLLPELRNRAGKILMALVFSQFWAYILLFINLVNRYDPEICIALTLFDYFFFLSSFCWMNVMSYDIWSTFSDYTRRRSTERRCKRTFIKYCTYAWGLPLALTIFLAVMNFLPLRHKPWIITPLIATTNCFMEDNSKFFYLYIPMLILNLINWLLFLITAFHVWLLKRGTGMLDSNAAEAPNSHRKQSHRFIVYIKLFVVMGLSWLFEVVSWLVPNFNAFWLFTDIYNAFIGFTIFVIFVCKKEIFVKLKRRFITLYSAVAPSQMTSSSSFTYNSNTSDLSDDGQETCRFVCMSPKGP